MRPALRHGAHDALALRGGAAGKMDGDRLADALLDGVARVQRFVGILEDDLRLAAEGEQGACGPRAVELADALEADLAAGRLMQLEQRHAGRRLAAAALADQAQHLAGADREADAVDRLERRRRLAPEKRRQRRAAHRIPFAQVARLDDRFGGHAQSRLSARRRVSVHIGAGQFSQWARLFLHSGLFSLIFAVGSVLSTTQPSQLRLTSFRGP